MDTNHTNPIYTDALPYIDVKPPYFALQDLSLLPSAETDFPIVAGSFSREQVPPPQNANDFCSSEAGRHTVILGSVAAAYCNPVKKTHYYLALEVTSVFAHVPTTQELYAKARVISAPWEKCRVHCEIEAFTPEGRFAGKVNVSYAILTEAQLVQVSKPVEWKRVFGKTWQPGEPSPYEDPITLRLVKLHSSDLATGIISLHDKGRMAGHFAPILAAPITILHSNANVLCRRLLTLGNGTRWLDSKTHVKCRRLAVAGEVLELKARKLDGGEYTHCVEFWDEGGNLIGTINYLFVEVDNEAEKPRL